MTAIVHMVLIRWAPATLEQHIAEARVLARQMESQIPGILTLAEGPDVSPEGLADGFNYGLAITFESAKARDEYLPHPAHQKLVAMFADGAIEKVTVLDLEAN